MNQKLQYLKQDKAWLSLRSPYERGKFRLSEFVKDFWRVRVPEFPADPRRVGIEIHLQQDGSVNYVGYKMIIHPLIWDMYAQNQNQFPSTLIDIHPWQVFGYYCVKETTTLLNLINRLTELELL